jgi:hypothetical protein
MANTYNVSKSAKNTTSMRIRIINLSAFSSFYIFSDSTNISMEGIEVGGAALAHNRSVSRGKVNLSFTQARGIALWFGHRQAFNFMPI